jgi:hypothetical protein
MLCQVIMIVSPWWTLFPSADVARLIDGDACVGLAALMSFVRARMPTRAWRSSPASVTGASQANAPTAATISRGVCMIKKPSAP